jgi:hypothetical protein
MPDLYPMPFAQRVEVFSFTCNAHHSGGKRMKTCQFIILPFFLPTLSANPLPFPALLFFGASIAKGRLVKV